MHSPWVLSEEVIKWIHENTSKGSTILEFGSGDTTKILVNNYIVYSIEEDIRWLDLEKKTHYIYAPIKSYETLIESSTGWYDINAFINMPKLYDLVIIDGPKGNNRGNFRFFDCHFKHDIPYIIDDTNRKIDKELSIYLENKYDKKSYIIKSTNKETTILLPK